MVGTAARLADQLWRLGEVRVWRPFGAEMEMEVLANLKWKHT
jgi:hypothetical protein